jgi:putative iron-only hydrogenase system regulator
MERRLGIVGIVIEDRKAMALQVNQILSEHGEMIAGRMGLPYKGRRVSVIALIVDGTTDELGSLTERSPHLFISSSPLIKKREG